MTPIAGKSTAIKYISFFLYHANYTFTDLKQKFWILTKQVKCFRYPNTSDPKNNFVVRRYL